MLLEMKKLWRLELLKRVNNNDSMSIISYFGMTLVITILVSFLCFYFKKDIFARTKTKQFT